ncbi:hypothetical protein BS17DRAFT_350566 [Gyrodon lividus]|nr:hypothetical protein BS17DRAFT_350566 [Gyrodon lividus]
MPLVTQIDAEQVWRVSFVYYLVESGSPHDCSVIPQCSCANDLWLRMIEGDDSGDDVWLWADGDEDWIRKNASRMDWLQLKEEQWTAARSALRRRLERTQRALRSGPNSTTNLTLPEQSRNARLRAATPAQRLAAMSWLIRTSKHREELDYLLGWSSRSNFFLGDLIWKWREDTLALLGSFPSFPEQPEAWKKFQDKREAVGCECLDSPLLCESAPDWFKMVVWLREEGNLDVDCLSPDPCQACESRAHDLYGTFYGAEHFWNGPRVPLLLAFSFEAFSIILGYTRDDSAMLPFARALVSKALDTASLLDVDELLRSVYGPGEIDLELPPWVNSHPSVAQFHLQKYSCQDEYLDVLPAGFADKPPGLMVLVGTIAWIVGCRFIDFSSGPQRWHDYWEQLLKDGFMAGLPLPELTETALILRNELKRINSIAQEFCCEGTVLEDHYWTSYSAIMMFVKSRIPDSRFVGCPRCHAIYLDVTAVSSSYSDLSRVAFSQAPAAEALSREQDAICRADPSITDSEVYPTASPVLPQALPTQYISSASVMRKHFGDIPNHTEYLERLYNDPIASGGYGIVYKCSLRDENDSYLDPLRSFDMTSPRIVYLSRNSPEVCATRSKCGINSDMPTSSRY